MSLRTFRIVVVCGLTAACCVPTLVSCGRSPSAPLGQLRVYVSDDIGRPVPGKKIEVRRAPVSQFTLSQSTDESGLALFVVPAGHYVVRVYGIGTPGPGFPFVEQSVDVEAGGLTEVKFLDCTVCVSPSHVDGAGPEQDAFP